MLSSKFRSCINRLKGCFYQKAAVKLNRKEKLTKLPRIKHDFNEKIIALLGNDITVIAATSIGPIAANYRYGKR